MFLEQQSIKYKIIMSMFVFMILYGVLTIVKPIIIFDEDGSIREFGINSSKKTIIPLWMVTILLSIFSYMIVFMMSNFRH